MTQPHLILIDASSYIFRAFHALPPLTRKSDGLPVGAVSGFCNMLFKLLGAAHGINGKMDAGLPEPTHIAAVFDASGTTFRNDLYSSYKANRSAPPEELIPQFSLIRQAVRAFDVAGVELVGYEADDLIAAYARVARNAGFRVTIFGSDKDLMQLVNDNVYMFDPVKNKLIDRDGVFDKFGVFPERVIDVQALAGDSVDNIPGVPGIGLKTAAQLIHDFGDLDALLAQAETIKQNKRRENLIAHAEAARLSKLLVTLDANSPLPVPLDDLVLQPLNGAQILGFLKALEFTTLTRRLAQSFDADLGAIDPQPIDLSGWSGAADHADAEDNAPQQPHSTSQEEDKNTRTAAVSGWTPQTRLDEVLNQIVSRPVDRSRYRMISTLDDLDALIERVMRQGFCAFDLETTSLQPLVAEIVGFCFALDVNDAFYIPVGHLKNAALRGDFFDDGVVDGQLDCATVLQRLRDILEAPHVLKIGQNIKYDMGVLLAHGVQLQNVDDTMLMSYVLDAGRAEGGHGLDALALAHLGHEMIGFKDVLAQSSGVKSKNFAEVGLEAATEYGAEDADITLRLWHLFKAQLVCAQKMSVYETLERPMVGVLARMEARGIRIDRTRLKQLSQTFAQKLADLEADIHALAGVPFNIASPKQLGEILFDKLGFQSSKKTSKGAISTNAAVLEDLAADGHAFPQKVLDWRALAKLKSTYTDALQQAADARTSRVHTSFSLAATTTGRLSSSDPNLQNIPVRTEDGRLIRTAFIPSDGCLLVSADYSQIELRLLAEIAGLDKLKAAFLNGDDIHAMTASEMFHVPLRDMTPEVRRRAKAINFGIIYGISAFGLANQLSISRTEAAEYIETYFARFPGIKDYMEATKTFCRTHGYVETLFGRRCHYPNIVSKNPSERSFNERAAINAPIQGSAADLMRRAMVRMEGALSTAGLGAQMLLQVHDELIFDVPAQEVERTISVVRDVMNHAHMPTHSFSVPLQVDARAAKNWDEAH